MMANISTLLHSTLVPIMCFWCLASWLLASWTPASFGRRSSGRGSLRREILDGVVHRDSHFLATCSVDSCFSDSGFLDSCLSASRFLDSCLLWVASLWVVGRWSQVFGSLVSGS